MANFCKQCAEDLFGKGTPSDFKGYKKYEVVICEGCGVIQVNRKGECISDDCLKQHGKEQQK